MFQFLFVFFMIDFIHCNSDLWITRSLYTSKDCSGKPFEIVEDPFEKCTQYFEGNNTKPFSQQFTEKTAEGYSQCIYNDGDCKELNGCRPIPYSKCQLSDLGGGHMAYVSSTVDKQRDLGVPSMFGLFTYHRYGDNDCKSDMETMDEFLELPKGRCVKYSDFEQWNDEELRFCEFDDVNCDPKTIKQCHIVQLNGCHNTGNSESYKAEIRFSDMTKMDDAHSMSMSLIVLGFVLGLQI